MATRSCTVDFHFPHDWEAEILGRAPLIEPAKHYFYPRAVEEIEIGAIQILLRRRPGAPSAMATFALGFAEPALPHGVWSCPNANEICVISGGYAYIVATDDPTRWMQVPYRPVTAIYPSVEQKLLIFASFRQLWALGPQGEAWETAPLSWEGLRVTAIEAGTLHGFGWDLPTDAEVPFVVDLATGQHTGGAGTRSSPHIAAAE